MGALVAHTVCALAVAPVAAVLVPRPVAAADPVEPARPAPARQKVLLLRTDGSGASEVQRQVVTKELQAQALRYRMIDIVFSAGDLTEEMFEFECTDPGVECLSKIGGKYGAQLVVYSEVAKNPSGQLQLNMRVVDIAQGRVAQTTVQPIESIDKPTAAVQRGLVVLLGPIDLPTDAGEAQGTLQVVLFGGGVALVYVDDKLVGRTSVGGLKVQVAAGTHTLRVVRAGFKEWIAKVTIVAGATFEQAVQLEQQAVVQDPISGGPGAPGAPADRSVVRSGWFWAAVGAGAAAIGVTAWLLLRKDDVAQVGAVAVSLDHLDAYLDPVFGGASAK